MELTAKEIKNILPQAEPFIMVDRVINVDKDGIEASKNITCNEWYWGDTSEEAQKFPECLIIESAAQAAFIFYKINYKDKNPDSLPLLAKIDSEFFSQIQIGDQLILKSNNCKIFSDKGFVSLEASNQNSKIADITVFFSLKNG